VIIFLNAASFSKFYRETIDLKNELGITLNYSIFISKHTSYMRDKQIDYMTLYSLRVFIMLFVSCMRVYAESGLTFPLRISHYST